MVLDWYKIGSVQIGLRVILKIELSMYTIIILNQILNLYIVGLLKDPFLGLCYWGYYINCSNFNVLVQNDPIDNVDNTKFPGMMIDSKLMWSKHAKYIQFNKARKCMNR